MRVLDRGSSHQRAMQKRDGELRHRAYLSDKKSLNTESGRRAIEAFKRPPYGGTK